jgi:hypothetical protein
MKLPENNNTLVLSAMPHHLDTHIKNKKTNAPF